MYTKHTRPRSFFPLVCLLAGCAAPPRSPDAPPVVQLAPTPPPPAASALPAASAPAPPPASATAVAASPPPEPNYCVIGGQVPMDNIFEPVHGSFTAPGLAEMAATIACKPGGTDRGGHALLRWEAGAWKVVYFWSRFDYRIRRGDCQVLPTSEGRDLAVCRQGYAMWGDISDAVVVIDYAAYDDEAGPTVLVAVQDNTGAACGGLTEVIFGGIESVQLIDVDRDGAKDVRVRLRAAKAKIPPQPPCDEVGAVSGGSSPKNLRLPPLQTVDFIAHGASLKPTRASARVLQAIDAMKPR